MDYNLFGHGDYSVSHALILHCLLISYRHSGSLYHVHPDGAQALQLGRAESDDQLSACTTEPHNVVRFMEDLQAEHCAPEPSSIV